MKDEDIAEFCSESLGELAGMIGQEFAKHETTFVAANALALERVAMQAAASAVATWLAIRASIRQGGN